ncbi:MAG: Omp28-related outer membrane protein [Candidatus Marinimicrobia bacterium]|nr:Omp28-related outer membrane protein [Candidatus Neomarinimicrobiota bacterium]
MSWPNPSDPYYAYNPGEANTRRTYYSVTGIPDAAFDGTSGYPGSPNGWNFINAASNVDPTVSIEVTGYYDDIGREGEISISVTPLGTTSGNQSLHVVLTESGLSYGGSNYENVMRDMITGGSGTSILLTTGSIELTDINFLVPEPIAVENAKLVIFVQNHTTKVVHNAHMVPVLSILADCDNDLGDIIDFGAINVQDLVKLVSIIMGTDTESDYCQLAAADVNEDGNVNIQDVVLLVEMILG